MNEYVVIRTDGTPDHPDDRFLVLNYGRGGPPERIAIEKFADEVQAAGGHGFAAGLRAALADPSSAPPQSAAGLRLYVVRLNDYVVAKVAESAEAAFALAGIDINDPEAAIVLGGQPLSDLFTAEDR